METTSPIQQKPAIPASAIATEAYYQWLNAGQPAGRDHEFWLKAEAALRNNGKPTQTKPAATAAAAKNGSKAASKR